MLMLFQAGHTDQWFVCMDACMHTFGKQMWISKRLDVHVCV